MLSASRTVKFNQPHQQHYHYYALGKGATGLGNFLDSKLINKTFSETAQKTYLLLDYVSLQLGNDIIQFICTYCQPSQRWNVPTCSRQQASRDSRQSRWWWARRLIKENVITFAPDSWQFCITKATRAARILRLLMRQAPQKAKLGVDIFSAGLWPDMGPGQMEALQCGNAHTKVS